MSKPNFKPQAGDILFTRIDGPFSWFLRLVNGSFGYSHACLVGKSENGEMMVYTTGACHRHELIFCYGKIKASEYLGKREYIICRYRGSGSKGLSDKQKKAILAWCQHHVGTPYPWNKAWQYYRQALHGLGVHRFNFKNRHKGEVLCYESVAAAYQNAGIELNPRAGNRMAAAYDIKELYFSPYLHDVYSFERHKDGAQMLTTAG